MIHSGCCSYSISDSMRIECYGYGTCASCFMAKYKGLRSTSGSASISATPTCSSHSSSKTRSSARTTRGEKPSQMTNMQTPLTSSRRRTTWKGYSSNWNPRSKERLWGRIKTKSASVPLKFSPKRAAWKRLLALWLTSTTTPCQPSTKSSWEVKQWGWMKNWRWC